MAGTACSVAFGTDAKLCVPTGTCLFICLFSSNWGEAM